MTSFHVHITTPHGIAYAQESTKVTLKSELGALTLLSHHADLIGSIDYTLLRITSLNNEEEEFVARRGTFSMDNRTNTLTILTTECAPRKTLSLVTAQEYLALINEKLAHGEDLGTFALEFMKGEKFVLEKQIAQEGE